MAPAAEAADDVGALAGALAHFIGRPRAGYEPRWCVDTKSTSGSGEGVLCAVAVMNEVVHEYALFRAAA